MVDHPWQRMWARKFSPFIASAFMCVLEKHPGLDQCHNKLFVPEGNLYAVYFDERELAAATASYTAFLKSQELARYAEAYEGVFRNFLAWSHEATQNDFSAYSDQSLADALSELARRLVDFSEYQFYAFLVSGGAGAEIEKHLVEKSHIMEAVSTPHKHTQITQARIELLQMARDGAVSDADLDEYVEKYAWLTIYDFADEPLSLDAVRAQIEHMKDPAGELETIEHHSRDGLRAYREYLKTIEDAGFKRVIEITHYFAYLKEMRDDYRRHAYFLWIPLWDEIARRLALTREEANCLLAEEIADALTHGKDYSATAKERHRRYALWLDEGELRIYSGDDVAAIEAMVRTSHHDVSEITGFAASKGATCGRVCVVQHQKEFAKFRDGDVLVTTMTHPEFLLLMKKASAIVTDEGGITCHAAIVARELHKPCIIGAKIATQVLQDGDMVKVDANAGTVRIIEHTKTS